MHPRPTEWRKGYIYITIDIIAYNTNVLTTMTMQFEMLNTLYV